MSPTTCTVDKLCNNMDAVDHKHAAAARKPKNPKRWRRRPQGRLLENGVAVVLRALTPRRESETAENQPVNAA